MEVLSWFWFLVLGFGFWVLVLVAAICVLQPTPVLLSFLCKSLFAWALPIGTQTLLVSKTRRRS